MSLQIADSWKIIDINAADVPADVITSMRAFPSIFQSHYRDTSKVYMRIGKKTKEVRNEQQEYIYKATVTDGVEADEVRNCFGNEAHYQFFLSIEELCAEHDAFYFRIIFH